VVSPFLFSFGVAFFSCAIVRAARVFLFLEEARARVIL
jgi:hypothetical protein